LVNYIVQSIDRLLKDKFKIKDGLADHQKISVKRNKGERQIIDETHRVLILDPATGTATFLYTVLDFIRSQFKTRKKAGQWGSYVHEHLLPRLFGFELLMAPYAVAHFKIGLALAAMDEEPLFRQQWSYEPRANERVNIFLTNTLEDLEHRAEQLGPLRALSNEANSAYEVKKHKPVLVVLGNPPYSGHSANKGEWISKLVRDYYFCDGQPLGERNPKWLQNDYVKFLRWGQWRIEQTGQGILGFITSNSYLDSPTFRGVRQNLMRTFDEIYILNLHGNSKKKEVVPGTNQQDKNVFDITEGVAIGIFVKLPPKGPKRKEKASAIVRHCDLWGAERQTKYDWLDGHQVKQTEWATLEPASPYHLFIPQNTKRLREYDRGWKIIEMMPIHSLGIAAGRDHFTVAFSADELRAKLKTFIELDSEEARRRFDLGPDSRDWQVELAQADLKSRNWDSRMTKILYRPFDLRQTCYTGLSRGFHCMARQDVMRHFSQGGPNLGLSTTRSVEIHQGWTHVFATLEITQLHSVSLKEVNYLFPLYLYPNGKLPDGDLFAHDNGRRPNLSAAFIKDFCAKLQVKFVPGGLGRPGKHEVGPELIFRYAYAVFHSPTYRERYAQFLRADFPRLPITSDFELFRALADFGAELVDLHARNAGEGKGPGFPVRGDNEVSDVRYQPSKGRDKSRVWINDKQYYEDVPETVWNFPVGGYLPAQRWLTDRWVTEKGKPKRKLSFEDITTYARIVFALSETKRLMAQIDQTIDQHGGWPLQ
jgi:predicted helicase